MSIITIIWICLAVLFLASFFICRVATKSSSFFLISFASLLTLTISAILVIPSFVMNALLIIFSGLYTEQFLSLSLLTSVALCFYELVDDFVKAIFRHLGIHDLFAKIPEILLTIWALLLFPSMFSLDIEIPIHIAFVVSVVNTLVMHFFGEYVLEKMKKWEKKEKSK